MSDEASKQRSEDAANRAVGFDPDSGGSREVTQAPLGQANAVSKPTPHRPEEPPTDFAKYHIVLTELLLEVKEDVSNLPMRLRADASARLHGRDASPLGLLPNSRYVCYIFQATATSGSGYAIKDPLTGQTLGNGNYIAGHFYIVKTNPQNNQYIWDVTNMPVTDRSGNTRTVSDRVRRPWLANRPPLIVSGDASTTPILAPWLEEADITEMSSFGYTVIPAGTVDRNSISRMYVRYFYGWEQTFVARDNINWQRHLLRQQGLSEREIVARVPCQLRVPEALRSVDATATVINSGEPCTSMAIRLGDLTNFVRRGISIAVAEGFWLTDPNANAQYNYILNDD